MSQQLLIPDKFIAGILGKPAFRLNSPSQAADAIALSGQVGFVYVKVGTQEQDTIALLETSGFRLIDTNVQLDRPREGSWLEANLALGYRVRFANPNDRSSVETVACESFLYTRFHLDPEIPNQHANQIKAAWAGNFFAGERGEHMVVACDAADIPVGFLQLLNREGELVIDLIAVAVPHQGKGVATAMIRFAVEHCRPQRERLVVGTQIANTPSLRAYEKLGFRVCDASYLFHYHGPLAA